MLSTFASPMLLLLLSFLAGGGMGVAGQDTSQLREHLKHFISPRYPMGGADGGREEARQYIKKKFQDYGLEVTSHVFNTSIMDQGFMRTIIGENVVGIARGPESGGSLLLVGADYDSVPNVFPLERNGAGVGAMLEVAREYMAATAPSAPFKRINTVLFVAFDLNTMNYGESSSGKPGSYHFLHQWLWPMLHQSLYSFEGAVILDSITNFNQESHSQYLPNGFSQTFPEAYKQMVADEKRGNFLAMVTRSSSQSRYLINNFTTSYRKDRHANLVRLQDLVVQTSASITTDTLAMLNHQAHFHFWTFDSSDDHTVLPALLLTDTDIYRKNLDKCFSPCSVDAFLTRRREQAIRLISSGLTHMLLDLQAERRSEWEAESGAPPVVMTAAATWIFALVAVMLQ